MHMFVCISDLAQHDREPSDLPFVVRRHCCEFRNQISAQAILESVEESISTRYPITMLNNRNNGGIGRFVDKHAYVDGYLSNYLGGTGTEDELEQTSDGDSLCNGSFHPIYDERLATFPIMHAPVKSR